MTTRVSERARVSLLVNGKQRVLGRGTPLKGALDWFGRARGRHAPPGGHVCGIAGRARSGRERLAPSAPAPVGIRYIELAKPSIDVQAGKRFGVGVSPTRASSRGGSPGGRGPASPGCSCCAHPGRPARSRSSSRRAGTPTGPSSSSGRHGERAAALRPRRAALGDDAAARDARPPHRSSRFPTSRTSSHSWPTGTGAPVDPRGVPRRSAAAADAREWGLPPDDVGSAAAAGDAARRGDRGRLRGVRGAARQAALGRQDADVHAAPAAARAAVPGRALRPPHPRRPRRGALVPRDAAKGSSPALGAPARCRRLRVPVAQPRSRRRGRSAGASAPSATRAALRGARRRRPRGSSSASARSPARRSSPACSTTSARSTSPRSRTSRASCSRPRRACATGGWR